ALEVQTVRVVVSRPAPLWWRGAEKAGARSICDQPQNTRANTFERPNIGPLIRNAIVPNFVAIATGISWQWLEIWVGPDPVFGARYCFQSPLLPPLSARFGLYASFPLFSYRPAHAAPPGSCLLPIGFTPPAFAG